MMSYEPWQDHWICMNCRQEVDDEFDVCWNCGMSRDGTPDDEFVDSEGRECGLDESQPVSKTTRLVIAGALSVVIGSFAGSVYGSTDPDNTPLLIRGLLLFLAGASAVTLVLCVFSLITDAALKKDNDIRNT